MCAQDGVLTWQVRTPPSLVRQFGGRRDAVGTFFAYFLGRLLVVSYMHDVAPADTRRSLGYPGTLAPLYTHFTPRTAITHTSQQLALTHTQLALLASLHTSN